MYYTSKLYTDYSTELYRNISNSTCSFFVHTFFKPLNDMFFFEKNIYIKVALKNHINLFFKNNFTNT